MQPSSQHFAAAGLAGINTAPWAVPYAGPPEMATLKKKNHKNYPDLCFTPVMTHSSSQLASKSLSLPDLCEMVLKNSSYH